MSFAAKHAMRHKLPAPLPRLTVGEHLTLAPSAADFCFIWALHPMTYSARSVQCPKTRRFMTTKAKDLTREAPRSPRVRTNGYALLARMADKGRATINNTAGEY